MQTAKDSVVALVAAAPGLGREMMEADADVLPANGAQAVAIRIQQGCGDTGDAIPRLHHLLKAGQVYQVGESVLHRATLCTQTKSLGKPAPGDLVSRWKIKQHYYSKFFLRVNNWREFSSTLSGGRARPGGLDVELKIHATLMTARTFRSILKVGRVSALSSKKIAVPAK
jgi:hypothetical protein